MRLPDQFAYKFQVIVGEYSTCKTEEEAYKKIMSVVDIMESQSYDYGSEWRRTNIIVDKSKLEKYGVYVVIVAFRIKDSY